MRIGRWLPTRFSLRTLLAIATIAACGAYAIARLRDADRREMEAAERVYSVGNIKFETQHRFSWLPRHKTVIEAHIRSRMIGKQDFLFLEDMPNLRNLYLYGLGFDDRAMEPISKLTKLERLNIADSKVTDAGLRLLSRCKHLKWLVLDNTLVEGRAFRDLASLPNLEYICAWSTPFDDASVHEISRCSKLTTFLASSQKITDASLRDLGGVQGLKELHLIGGFTREGVQHLKGLPNLRVPFLVGTDFSIIPTRIKWVRVGSRYEKQYRGREIWTDDPPETVDAIDLGLDAKN